MQRKSNEPEIKDLIRRHGWDWHKFQDARWCPHCHNLLYKTDGMPYDGEATIAGVKVPIEIKQEQNIFPFSTIRDNQRYGMQAWTKQHGHEAWLAITLGQDAVNARTPFRRRTFMIPTSIYYDIESSIILDGRVSIPMCQESASSAWAEMTFVDLFAEYELPWSNWAPQSSGWSVPRDHIFAQTYPLLFFPRSVNIYPRKEETCSQPLN
jgi:sarcosine oxidase delta subunit